MTEADIILLKEWTQILENITDFAIIGRVNGIKFIIHTNENTGENTPHLHVETSSAALSIAIDDGRILACSGKIAPIQLKMTQEWMRDHKAFIIAKWNELANGIEIAV